MFSRTGIILILAAILLSLPAKAQVQVAASIRPLQLLAAAITEGISKPVLLMPDSADPHHYTLRPSDRRALADSDIVLWVGPEMERPLARVMSQVKGRVIAGTELPNVVLHRQHEHLDGHLWLDIGNALAMARVLTEELVGMDAGNAPRYELNHAVLRESLLALDEKLRTGIEALGSGTFAVYHNAYLYLEERYGLRHGVAFTDHEDLSPGIRRLLQIRDEISAGNIDCVLVEPGVNVAALQAVIEDERLRYIQTDVLGRLQPLSQGAYVAMMAGLGAAIMECLEQGK